MDERTSALQNERDALEGAKQRAMDELNITNSRCEDLESQIASLRDRYAALSQGASTLRQENLNLTSNVASLQRGEERTKTLIAQRDEKVSKLEKLLSERDAKIDARNAERDEFAAEVAKLKAIIGERDVEISKMGKLKENIAEQAKEMSSLKSAHSSEIAELRSQNAKNEQDKQALLDDIEEIRKLKEKLDAHSSAQENRIEGLEKSFSTLWGEKQSLENEVAKLETTVDVSTKANKDATERAAASEEHASELLREVKNIKGKLEMSDARLSAALNSNASLRQENEALGKEYSSAMERLKASEASANAIEGQLRGKAEEVNRLAQSVEKLEAERTAYGTMKDFGSKQASC